jgi:hypothetical protein
MVAEEEQRNNMHIPKIVHKPGLYDMEDIWGFIIHFRDFLSLKDNMQMPSPPALTDKPNPAQSAQSLTFVSPFQKTLRSPY